MIRYLRWCSFNVLVPEVIPLEIRLGVCEKVKIYKGRIPSFPFDASYDSANKAARALSHAVLLFETEMLRSTATEFLRRHEAHASANPLFALSSALDRFRYQVRGITKMLSEVFSHKLPQKWFFHSISKHAKAVIAVIDFYKELQARPYIHFRNRLKRSFENWLAVHQVCLGIWELNALD